MEQGVKTPKFKDGEFLTEAELYQLAWLPFELHRLSNQTRGHIGFFSRSIERAEHQNQFELTSSQLTVADLFVISPEGIPFILVGEQRLELSEVTVGKTTLFASVYFANGSKAFENERFSKVAVEAADASEKQEVLNGYKVLLHWGNGTALEIESTSRFTLELGELTGSDLSTFELKPTAYFPAGLLLLKNVVDDFTQTLEGYIQLLLDPTTVPGADRATLLDRLEDLQRGLQDAYTPTYKLVSDAHFMVAAAKGFYLRLAYAQDAQDPRYRNCRGLEGRMLEHQLDSLYNPERDALGDMIGGLSAISSVVPPTGREQIRFFSELEVLFDVERNTRLLQGLHLPGQQSSETSQDMPRPEPREPLQTAPQDDGSRKPQAPQKSIIPLTRERE